MDNQTFVLASIILCSLGGWYVVITKYLALKNMAKEDNMDIPPHIPGMGPPPAKAPLLTEEILSLGGKQPSTGNLSTTNNYDPATFKRLVCNKACMLHLLGFAIISGVPFLNILLPAFFWLWIKEEHPFLANQGKEVLNFQISYTLIQFLCLGGGVLLIRYAPNTAASLFAMTKIAKIVFSSGMYLPFNIFTVVPFFWGCIVILRGAVAAFQGMHYKYPATQQFFIINKPKKSTIDANSSSKKSTAPEAKNTKSSSINFS